MARWYGEIGYADQVETSPGIYKDQITKRNYYGELTRNTRRLESSSQVIDDVSIGNEISIVADPYAYDHFHLMKYVEFMGAKWKITSVEVQRPRLILTIGGVYNG